MALDLFQMEKYLSRVLKIHVLFFHLLISETEAYIIPSADVLTARFICCNKVEGIYIHPVW